MGTLNKSVSSRVMSAIGRDAILELIMKNVEYEALNWGLKLVRSDGMFLIICNLSKLLWLYACVSYKSIFFILVYVAIKTKIF